MANHPMTVRRPERSELPAVAAAYTAANLHDPVLSWVIDDEDARRQLTGGPRQEAMAGYLAGVLDSGQLLIAEDEPGVVAGISLWERIDHSATGTPEPGEAEGARFVERFYGDYADRMKQLIELCGQRHPQSGAYWYLQNIVVDTDRRGQGVGGAMLDEHLRRVDAEGASAYLEASSPRNRRLYSRVGFADLGDPIELPGGPRLQPMWRPAAAEADRLGSAR
ncbi:GNAT family N-acetyltransferase [Streptomonospora litoralis]|uniref:Acetyltransferase (GNAT) family protein n=1 Tax=Streptomonospora litoralis TaxID=2498135 RepID=A0A4P6Q629_9ACTN|nr:GNAT family N-acetyltransferase [Streptomonospora litoralis]QBI54354.1 Acetyltransferase (GNAT) family protein [Streptomonospora litoralis]